MFWKEDHTNCDLVYQAEYAAREAAAREVISLQGKLHGAEGDLAHALQVNTQLADELTHALADLRNANAEIAILNHRVNVLDGERMDLARAHA